MLVGHLKRSSQLLLDLLSIVTAVDVVSRLRESRRSCSDRGSKIYRIYAVLIKSQDSRVKSLIPDSKGQGINGRNNSVRMG